MTHAASFSAVRLLGPTALIVVGWAALAATAAPVSDDVSDEPCPVSAARIILWHSGKVTLNGAEVPIEKLGTALATLVPRATEVCYAQENPKDVSRDLGSFAEGLIFFRMPLSIYKDTSFLHRAASFPGRTPNNRWRGP